MRLFDELKKRFSRRVHFVRERATGQFKVGRWVVYDGQVGIVYDRAGAFYVVALVDTAGQNRVGGSIAVEQLSLREAYAEEIPRSRATIDQCLAKGYRSKP